MGIFKLSSTSNRGLKVKLLDVVDSKEDGCVRSVCELCEEQEAEDEDVDSV